MTREARMEGMRTLIMRAQAGDLEAFGRIVERFQDMAYGYAYSVLDDFDLAQDAAQEAFIEAYRKLPDLREPGAFPGWLRRVVFTCCNRLTRGKRVSTVPLESVADVASAAPDPAEIVQRSRMRDYVLGAIRSLPEHERVVTTLFYINGYSHEEIAGFLEVPLTTVKSRLHTSRGRLRETVLPMVSDSLRDHALPDTFTGRVLANIPPGRSYTNFFAQGLCTILQYSGTPADYDTIMGDLGLAFITQASEQVAVIDGAPDVGWWPMAPDCIPTYLGLVERTVGRRITYLQWEEKSFSTDPAQHYRDRFERPLKASIDAGRPALVSADLWFIVSGYDREEPPLLGHCPGGPQERTIRLDSYPFVLVVLGDELPRMDRTQADLDALRHAVALGRDAVPMPGGFVTGQKAFALWTQMLRDTERLGQARWHANVCLHLGINRHSAIAYLRSMAGRRAAPAATHLEAAADRYQEVVDALKIADTSVPAMISPQGREELARLAERVAGIELRAVADLERAVAAS